MCEIIDGYCVFDKLEMTGGARIICPKCMGHIMNNIRCLAVNWKFVMTSGGMDPIHPGHISSFTDAKAQGDYLIVVVNNDAFLERKKGKAFMPQRVRAQITSMIKGVDYVVPLNPSRLDDDSVCAALEIIRPDIFAKGGDRNIDNIPEKATCDRLGIKIVQGMGDDKHWSSSDFLNKWSKSVFSKE